jgi:hypothetical protein
MRTDNVEKSLLDWHAIRERSSITGGLATVRARRSHS